MSDYVTLTELDQLLVMFSDRITQHMSGAEHRLAKKAEDITIIQRADFNGACESVIKATDHRFDAIEQRLNDIEINIKEIKDFVGMEKMRH